MVEVEMGILAELGNVGFPWSPRLIGGDASFDNPALGCPYMVLAWVAGRPLEWTDALPLTEEHRRKILGQLTDIQLDLAIRTQKPPAEPNISSSSSTLDYLTRIIDGRIGRVANGKLPHLDLRACFVHRALVRHAVDTEIDIASSSMTAITHGNLTSKDIMVDDDLNIRGIVNWELARRRPLQMAQHLPDMLSLDHDRDEDDVRSGPTLQPSSQLARDRTFVSSYYPLSAQAITPPPLPPLQHRYQLLETMRRCARIMKRLVSDPDADWNRVIIMTCFSKGIHRWLAQRSWLVQETKRQIGFPSNKDIDMEVDDFLSAKANKGYGLVRNAVLKDFNRRAT
ncbi:hypothetical protein PG984_008896 [Apiospora sp. TS-2023a]